MLIANLQTVINIAFMTGIMSTMELSKRLKEIREEKGLSQRELAKLLNIDKSTVAKYETGERSPDADMIVKLADFFDVSTDFLLGRKEYKI